MSHTPEEARGLIVVYGVFVAFGMLLALIWLLDWRASKQLERKAWRELTRKK